MSGQSVWLDSGSWSTPDLTRLFEQTYPISQPPVQYFNIPINIYAGAISILAPDIKQVMVRLDRHENLLQEIYEMVKVIEVETRRLNPDSIYDHIDTAESELGQVFSAVREKRYPPPWSPEMEALLTQAIERKKHLAQPAEGSIKR